VTVDAIIVNWNGGDELLVAIESARRFGANVIVVDNASEFGVARGLGAHPDVTLIRSPRNLGFAAGCNRVDPTTVLEPIEVVTGWYDDGILADGKNKLVPSISLMS